MNMSDRNWPPLIERWIKWQRAQSLSDRTILERANTVTRCARDTSTAPEDLAAEEILTWLAGHTHWSAGTRSTHHSQLKAWFRWLQLSRLRPDDPMMLLGKPRRPSGLPRPVPDVHLPRLLAEPMRTRTRAMFVLAIYAGLRVHEIAKFRGEHADLRAGTLTVRGKGGRTAELPMYPAVAELAERMPRSGWWFPSDTPAGHVNARSVSSTMGRTMRRLEVPGTAHSLRHWHASAIVASGADLRTAQHLLRHASLATTQIYVKVAESSPREALARLDPLHPARGVPAAG